MVSTAIAAFERGENPFLGMPCGEGGALGKYLLRAGRRDIIDANTADAAVRSRRNFRSKHGNRIGRRKRQRKHMRALLGMAPGEALVLGRAWSEVLDRLADASFETYEFSQSLGAVLNEPVIVARKKAAA